MSKSLKAFACAFALGVAAAGAATGAVAQDLTMAVWGGGGANTWREAFIKQFSPPGDGHSVKMVEVPNPAGALRSPAAANQYNLALVTYFEAIALSQAGLIETFTDAQLPGAADVDRKYLTKDKAGRLVGLPVYFTYYGIAYNTDLAKAEDFASWQGLADPKWKSKLSLTRPVYLAPYDSVIMAKAMGGSERDIDPGFKLLERIVPSVLATYTSLAHMNTLLTRGEVAAVPFYASRVWALRRQGATNVQIALPKEGVLMLPYVVVVPKGAKNLDKSLVWMNYIAGAEPQLRAALLDGWLPMNSKVKLPEELQKTLGRPYDEILKSLYSPDWTVIVERNEERVNRAEKLMSGVKQ
ncbi:MAG: extracellular solute-binding protein [Proteobacteria bacterium]|nr:extracellular solute-binding protein [Pseudomonadota bacterium]